MAKFWVIVFFTVTLTGSAVFGNWSQIKQDLEQYPALKMAVLEALSNKRQVNVENGRKLELKVYEKRRFATLTFWFVSSRAGYESLWTVLCKKIGGYWACSVSKD